MANEINGLMNGRTQQSGDRQVQSIKRDSTKSGSTADSGHSSSGADKISLTSTAARLKALEEQLSSQPEVDLSRISEVQSALQEGRYNVDPESIADKMINFEENF